MNDNMKILATDALIAWEELEELSETVLANLMMLELSSNNKIFSYDNDKIEANVLGFRVSTKRKVISVEGCIKYMEYSFVHLIENGETILLNLYLDKDGHVWLDYKEREKLCDYNEQHLAKYIYETLIVVIISGDLTKPSVD
jgi:hypothetical protein